MSLNQTGVMIEKGNGQLPRGDFALRMRKRNLVRGNSMY